MLILLTRALEESKRTAASLAREGHEAVLSPVLDMVPTGGIWPAGVIDGVIATSARAFELLSAPADWPLPEARRLLPLFLVGERTQEAARERSFEGPALIAPDAKTLAADICARWQGSWLSRLSRGTRSQAGSRGEPHRGGIPHRAGRSLCGATRRFPERRRPGPCGSGKNWRGLALFPAQHGNFPAPCAQCGSRPHAA